MLSTRVRLHQVPIQGGARQRGQDNFAGFGALAKQVQPMCAVRIELDRTQCGADQLAGAQPRRVGEVENEAQPLCRNIAING